MSETTHIHPQDFLDMLKRSETLGAYKTLNWLCFELTDLKEVTAKDVLDLIHHGIGAIGDQLCSDFKQEQWITTSLQEIIEKRKKQEKKEAV